MSTEGGMGGKKLYECLIKRPVISSKNATIYTAGYAGYDFFDLCKLTLSPKTAKDVVDMYKELLKEVEKEGLDFNKLAFIDRTTCSMAVASWLSYEVNREAVVVRLSLPCKCRLCRKKLGIWGSMEPPISEGDKVVIITDVITTGGTVLDAADILKEAGAEVVAAVAILDREERRDGKTGKEKIEERGITVFSYRTRSELLALGFIGPSKEDIEQKDFLDLLIKALRFSIEDEEQLKEYFEEIAENILKLQNEKVDERNKMKVINMVLSILMQARTLAPSLGGGEENEFD